MEKINIYSTCKNGYQYLSNLLNGELIEELTNLKGVRAFIKFKTIEHAYQCKKALFMNEKILAVKILNAKTGWEALTISREIKVNQKWHDISETELEKSMRLCFNQNPKALQLLLSTKDAVLIHDSSKNIDLGKWKIVFPQILMTIRTENQ